MEIAVIVVAVTVITIIVIITVVAAITAIKTPAQEIHFSTQTVQQIITVAVIVVARILVYNQEDIYKCF